MNINVEYRNESGFSNFFNKITSKRIAVIYDVNTKPYAEDLIRELQAYETELITLEYPDEELVPTEEKCEEAYQIGRKADYILAVGSGTLNDMAKSVATRLGVESGVLATAASMDGYCSKGAALMRGGFKVTDEVNAPSDILIDLEIIRRAPKVMTAAGFGDILGKYTCLSDWQMAKAVKGEPIHEQAFTMMQGALSECVSAFDKLKNYESDAVAKLMNALITAGISMAVCGNSRPASGSEHHISHFLEMDFVRRGEKIPLHGLKVAIGTLISIEIYKYIAENKISFQGAETVYALAKALPTVESLQNMLKEMGCPTRFSQIGVRKNVLEETLEKAYTVRERYTVLTLANELDIMKDLKERLIKKYF